MVPASYNGKESYATVRSIYLCDPTRSTAARRSLTLLEDKDVRRHFNQRKTCAVKGVCRVECSPLKNLLGSIVWCRSRLISLVEAKLVSCCLSRKG